MEHLRIRLEAIKIDQGRSWGFGAPLRDRVGARQPPLGRTYGRKRLFLPNLISDGDMIIFAHPILRVAPLKRKIYLVRLRQDCCVELEAM